MSIVSTEIAPKKYDSIQLMRGIAAVSVIFQHINMVNNGAFGVDLFFLISGFIMMYITEKDTKFFLQKRIIRIAPLYWSALLLISMLIMLAPNIFRTLEFRLEYLIKSMLFIPYYFTGPLEEVNSLLPVGWTLIYEMFFYFVFFVSMKISHKYRHLISTIFLSILVVIGFVSHSENVFVRFYCIPLILEFSLGMWIYKFLTHTYMTKIKIADKRFVILLWMFASLIWIGLFAEKYILFLHGIDRFIRFGIPSFIFFIIVFKATENNKVPRFFVVLGGVSYSLYITHLFVVQGFSRLIYNIDDFSLIGVAFIICVVVPTTIGVAWVSWFIFENKFTSWLRIKLKV